MADTNPVQEGVAQALYALLEQDRRPFLDRAIDSSKLTIPTLIPPHGHTPSSRFYTPFQSVGARGVNNLASKLLLSQLPINTPCFRLDIDQFTLEKLGEDPKKKAEVDAKLNKMERSVQRKIETEALRVSVFEALKHLLVAGNALLYMPLKGGMRVFNLHNFVIQRDPMGNVLDIVIKESVAPSVLTEEVRALIAANTGEGKPAEERPSNVSRSRSVDLFTHVKWNGKLWDVYQEVKGVRIPSSVGTYPEGKSPWLPLRMTRIDGESYGRGYVEEYIGDLTSLEGLQQAVVEGAAAAAKLLFLVNPNGTTSAKDLAETENGGFADGTPDDVKVLQLEKYNDFRVAMETSNKIEERLSFAFMLNSAVQRAGERVTAAEIRFMAQELESGLGGIYSILSQEFQLPMVTRLMFTMTRAKELPVLPKGIVKPMIVTGLEALGRGNDLDKLDTFMQGVTAVPQAMDRVNWGNYMTRRATALGMDTEGLIVSDDEYAEQQAQAKQEAMLSQGIGPGIGALGQVMKQGMQNAASEAPAPA